jgi:tRNA(Arg) A34 adenosine deaminase TadA
MEKYTSQHSKLEQLNFMKRAAELSKIGSQKGAGGPFGCVIVKNGQIVGEGHNRVTSTNDPTAHAEIVAIREACKNLNSFQLDGCEIYTSCEPCPMCLGAIYWARPKAIYYGNSRVDAAKIGFDDQYIYDEIKLPLDNRQIPILQMGRSETIKSFKFWEKWEGKTKY